MHPSAGLPRSNNLDKSEVESTGKRELISKSKKNKTKIIKFNWRDFDGLVKVI